MMNIISLGLGVQSVALYFMSSLGILPRADYAIVADPGRERQATYQYLEYLIDWKDKANGIPIIVKNDMNLYHDLLNNENPEGDRFASIPAFVAGEDGKEGMLRRQCTREYKIQVIDNAIRDIYKLSPGDRRPKTKVWKGISVDEIERMTNPEERWKIHVYPFTEYWFSKDEWGRISWGKLMSRADIIRWYEKYGLPIPVKSACVFCPYRSDTSWAEMKRSSPEDFAAAVAVDRSIRNSSMKRINKPCFLHRSLRPLDEILFDTSEDLWGNECSGNCNI